ncbi:PD-(D/E)XK motif protein [Chryseobacterium cucumeris]|uniref:PD-(D/E)XK motif protein n=1 Tax=Chryseobacterium cucumeris TaxID=1813611 RepID=UPI001F4B59DF|nr:PD-(D/E)XK motif protein [Chryseobacterium cucumeris]
MENSGYKKFLELQQKDVDSVSGYISVESVPFSDYHKIGVSPDGFPLFFVKCDNTVSSIDINLELISVLFSQDCSIREKELDSEDIYTIVLLKTLNRDLQQYFTDVFSIILQQLVVIPTERELHKEIRKVIDLFSSISKPPVKSIQGLWSELLIIDFAKNPEYLISSWHVLPSDKYDFNDGKDKLEVKSTSKQNRVHRFSIEQLNGNVGSELIVASLFVLETGLGKSILNLRDSIISKIKNIDIHLKLNEIIYRTIGNQYEKLGDIFFDYQMAIDSLTFYNAKNIPNILSSNIPSELSNITFDCDLTSVSEIKTGENQFEQNILFLELGL